MNYRIVNRMKVTALIPEELIAEAKALSGGKNITEALIIVLQEWIATRKLQALNKKIQQTPLRFEKGYSATKIRQMNRKR
jgi:hypothetical protein